MDKPPGMSEFNNNQLQDKDPIIAPPPGWNDPPTFGIDVNSVAKPVPTKLNKRVPFPGIMNDNKNESESVLPNLTPPPASNAVVEFVPSLPVPFGQLNSKEPVVKEPNSKKPEVVLNADAKVTTLNFLDAALVSGNLDKNTIEHVRKRMDILGDRWAHLSNEVQKSLFDLAQFLREGNSKEAEKICLRLSAGEMTQVGPFITAIMKIIRSQESP